MSEKSDYQKRVLRHHQVVDLAGWHLMVVAKMLCPGDWVLQILPNFDSDKPSKRCYLAVVSNGDDNVTGQGDTVSAALAALVNYLLRGSVFPLGGSGGTYIHPADRGWIKPEAPFAQGEGKEVEQ